ncbi:MAG TPA: AAA family ATPase [Candidatus Nanopelagicales bacterium]|nr:AAA family ATPase [Candidatus Nanopelagicales bacterium]
MSQTKPSSNDELSRALGVVRDLLRERGTESGANIGHVLRREMPDFNPQALGFTSLSQLLLNAADEIVVVGRKGSDRVWALGETVSTRDLEHVLGAETEAEAEAPLDTGPRVTHVELVNFKGCRDVRLDLSTSGLTVLVGPNSSGKSTLIHGISSVSQVTRGKLGALFGGSRDVRRLRSDGATGPMVLAISAENGVELRLSAEPASDDDVTRFAVSLTPGKGQKAESWTVPGPPPDPPLRLRPESRLFWPSVLLRLHAEALAEPSEVVEGEPRLSFDGAGLPTVLAYLATTDPKRLQALVESVRQIVPAVEETRQTLRRWDRDDARGEREPPAFRYQLDVKMKGAGWVPADLLSEGTLFAFGIHAVLHQRKPPRILLMDDIDRGLHPKAQRSLIQQIKQVAGEGGPQILLSTHSPYILDELPPESVRVVRSDGSGTRVRALVDHPEWQEWKSSMTAGEFWTYVGEDWLEQGE